MIQNDKQWKRHYIGEQWIQGPTRSASSKTFDFHRGGVIESCVRYGFKEADQDLDGTHTCSLTNDRDGMTLQASTDGKIFTNVLRLVSGQFPELKSENFTCMRTVISTKAYPQFMSSTLQLCWKQISGKKIYFTLLNLVIFFFFAYI